jgi:peptidoglycan/xylan/chitin deacetylase (PgdA/CDA1 family)
MMPSPGLLRLCFDVLHITQANHIFAPFTRGRGIIFCLHQVVPGGGDSTGFKPNAQLEVSPEFLDATLTHVKRRGYRLLSLTDAVSELHINRRNAEPFAVFTLDDGYRDNAQHAAPVFRKHNCPYTIYVTPGIADGTCELWWKILEAVIVQSNQISVPVLGNHAAATINTTGDAKKHEAFQLLSPRVADMPERTQRAWIRSLAASNNVDVNALCRSLGMNWDELLALTKDPLCTIGAHTLNHFRLSRLSEHEARTEMRDSSARITAELKQPISSFAYPYGDIQHAGPREFACAEKLGFRCAVTTRKGVVFDGHRNHLHALPRVMLSGRYQKLRYVDALMSGVPLALLNKFKKVNVNPEQGGRQVATST